MSEELTQVLARAAGPTGARPDLGAVWSAGRARRRRARGLRAAAAVVVAAALAVGAVALASGGGDEDVVAGPQGGAAAVPPAEPEDVMVSVEVTTGRRSEGRPVVEPGEPLSVVYRGLVELFERGRLATWERWDGQGWVPEVGLIAGDREPGGFRGGAVAPLEPPPTVPEDRRADGGPDTFPTPEDADPGWYRICVPMTGTRDTTVGGTVPAGAGPEVTAPPETVLTAGQPIEPCV
ncbi:MAG TPA: hypothetical protein VFU19_09565, partial [Iamia sp.]|nr:hypothetical protein [Iamia sp.]